MERECINQLIEWKESANRKPLIVRGARQVGKTWIIKHFGNTCYQNMVYVNFEDDPALNGIFAEDFDIQRIVTTIELYKSASIGESTLIVFDEIQSVKRGLMSLKYFYEKAPQYHVIAAGSLLGMSIHEGDSFPVGKVDFLDLYPMNFREFLRAMGENQIADLLQKATINGTPECWAILQPLHEKLINHLRTYLYIGGMPEVVDFFRSNCDYEKARDIQTKIVDSYRADFSKHATLDMLPRLNQIWNIIPQQLAKENKKFIFSQIRKGARASEFELAIEWLKQNGLIHKSSRISTPNLPLMAYEEINAFKIFLNDIGLLGAMCGLQAKTIIEGNAVFKEFKGALTEQFVFSELRKSKLYYWAKENGNAEVDFIIEYDNQVVPIEAKASDNLSAKSFNNFCQKYNTRTAIKTSELPYKKNEIVCNVPLYAIGCSIKTN